MIASSGTDSTSQGPRSTSNRTRLWQDCARERRLGIWKRRPRRPRSQEAPLPAKVECRTPKARISWRAATAGSYFIYFDHDNNGETERLPEPVIGAVQHGTHEPTILRRFEPARATILSCSRLAEVPAAQAGGTIMRG